MNTLGNFTGNSTKWMLNFTSTKLSIIRCDNAKQFVNGPLISYCKDQNMRMDLTRASLPELNGMPEGMNTCLNTIAASVFLQRGTSNSKVRFHKAIELAVHLKNRTSRTDSNKTLFHLLFIRPPNILWLMKFGSDVFVKIATQKIQQLSFRTSHNSVIPALVVGHTDNRNAYQCW